MRLIPTPVRSIPFFRFWSILACLLATATSPAIARSAPESFADMAEKLQPAVVNISTTQAISAREDGLPDFELPPGSPLEPFFRDFLDRNNDRNHKNEKGEGRKRKAEALGSGFIIDTKGYVVTNNHVVEDAEEITVSLTDNTKFTAKIIGKDPKTDLALLKIESTKPLPAVAWGDSDKARVGDWVLAIGDPYGLGGTVTAGILSARARDINSGPYDDYLQTDAAINRGNSGGPMFNMDGDVIGVNTAIFSPTGGSVGIGFAIPSNLAKSIISQLRDNGQIKRGWLGVRIQTVTKEIADGLGLPDQRGALVSSLTEDGPSAKAGLLVGDVIIRFDGKDVNEMRRLPLMVAGTEVGKKVNLTILRKGKELDVALTLGELPASLGDDENTPESPPEKKAPQTDKVDELGLNVIPLNDKARQRFSIAKGVTGLVVATVDQDSPAAEQGILVGDVITEVGQEEIKSTKQLSEQVKKAKAARKPALLLINRKGDLHFIAIKLQDNKQ